MKKSKNYIIFLFLLLFLFCCENEDIVKNNNSNPIVEFNTMGGNYIDSQVVENSSLVDRPENPTKIDYTFIDWYKEPEGLNIWDFLNDKVTSNIILYAKWSYNNSETFEQSNRPELEYNVPGDYFFIKPWNYEKQYNANRKYPLIIYLHGASQTKYLKNLYYMGAGYYHWSDTLQNMTIENDITTSDEFRKTYPCFAYVPQEPGTLWNNAELIAQIEQFKTDYRIDTNRIYIHGFSMGGGATYSLAEAYYNYNGQLFAGIIRLNGYGSYVSLPDEIVRKTSIWLMVGLNDIQSRIDGIRNSYDFLRDHSNNNGAIQSEHLNYLITKRTYSHLANTLTLTKDGIEFAKKTEYPNDDHFVTEFPFWDPSVLAWLFNQSLQNRQ